MAKAAQYSGYIKGGKLYIRLDSDYWPLPDGEVLVTAEKVTAARSPKANRYYWGVVVKLIAHATGYTPDEVHEMLKAKFIPRIIEIPGDDGATVAEFKIGGSTRTLDSDQFWQYTEEIRQWAHATIRTADGTQMLYIPDPDPEWRWRQIADGRAY
jgi:hypothetical protein